MYVWKWTQETQSGLRRLWASLGTLIHVVESQEGAGNGASGPGVKAGASVRELGRAHLEGGREKAALPSSFLMSVGPTAVLGRHP